MDRLVQFGDSDDVVAYYRFPLGCEMQIQPTFGAKRIPHLTPTGLDGGWRSHGRAVSASESGSVQGTMILIPQGVETIDDVREAFHRCMALGETRLFKEKRDGTLMWTWAELDNFAENQAVAGMPHLRQQIQFTFKCPKSRWFGKPDDSLNAGTGAYTEGAVRDASNAMGDTDTISLTNNGTAYAGVKVTIAAGGGVTIVNPKVARKDAGGTELEYVKYTDTINATESVVIDARNHQLVEGMTVATGQFGKLDVLTGGWLMIPPGTHEFTFTADTLTGGDATVSFDWWDTWY